MPCTTWDREVGPPVPADGWAYEADSPEAILLAGLLGSLLALPDPLEGVRRSQVARSCLALLRETLGSPAVRGRRTDAAGRVGRWTQEAGTDEDANEAGVRPPAVPLAQAIRRYVGANLHDPALGMDTLCRHFALSRTALRRIMGPASGDVARIIRRWRLHEAHREIVTSGALAGASEPSILSIGEHWGFEQERSFRRAFVREFGMAPKELRRRVRQGEITPLPDAGRLFERWFQGAE